MTQSTVRHITSINDLTNVEIEEIFRLAEGYLKQLGDPALPYRVAKATNVAQGTILASLFYEPSTRTRLSFESAMLRLGGSTMASVDPSTSSAAKGESLADSVRVTANYADVIVLRHPRDGAARFAAEYSPIPVINGGDGSHEHPTQTLCDLFTLKREKKSIRRLNVAISGDLKGSRTIHSFVYALARFGATINPMPAKGMALPEHVGRRLVDEFGCVMVPKEKLAGDTAPIDALYVTPEEPHQLSLIPDSRLDVSIDTRKAKVDVVYVTRYQKERWQGEEQSYVKIDEHFLSDKIYSETRVLHPLPRVGELDVSLDKDKRAVYFQQAAYGVPVRMALISLLLGLQAGHRLQQYEGGFRHPEHAPYDRPLAEGLRCINKNCIVHEPSEASTMRNKFHLIRPGRDGAPRLRCFYCETDVADFVAADRKSKRYAGTAESFEDLQARLHNVVMFDSPTAAEAQGYRPAEAPKRRKAARAR